MHRPFPALTDLVLEFAYRLETPVSVVPASFLGGSAPTLKSLRLSGIPILALPKLLLSAIHLVDVELSRIPHSGHISQRQWLPASPF
jgi:hypothetical protein